MKSEGIDEFVVAALYCFAPFEDHQAWQEPLTALCQREGIKGTLLLASEGLNGTVSGSRQGIDALKAFILADKRFSGIEWKESFFAEQAFHRLKIRLKKEIVTMKVEGIDPNECVGQHVEPSDWNHLISDPDVVLVDTRNDYEFEMGTFENALDPGTKVFSEFPGYVEKNLDPTKHRKVAMFCTGGIRCEKATAYMLKQGFKEVYHLKGGILKYLEEVPQKESRWKGECFVFDDRVSVTHGMVPGEYGMCYSCQHPVSAEDRKAPEYEEGVSCPRCFGTLNDERLASARERQKQCRLARERQGAHVGDESESSRRRRARRA